jgi:hypothetical protein
MVYSRLGKRLRYHTVRRLRYSLIPHSAYVSKPSASPCKRQSVKHQLYYTHLLTYTGPSRTVQELIAPRSLSFFTREGNIIGTRTELSGLLSEVTSIPVEALERKRLLAQYDVEERLSWAKARVTKREEDSAYALLGLFDIFMPPIYGEGKVHAMKRLRENIQKAEEKTERDLLKSLKFEQMSSRQTTIRDAHQETCQWLLRQSEYVDWLDPAKTIQHRGLLWIKGKPGAGKSTIMKFAHRCARELLEQSDHVHATDDQGVVVGFFFNARGSTMEKTTLGMYRSLLVQLLDRRSYLRKIPRLLDFPATMLSDNYQWTVGTLQTLLRDAILNIKTPVVCFIDALDECEEQEIRDMLSFLGQLGELTSSVNVTFQVCLASRHYPHISIDRGIQLVLEGQEGHTHDISEYLRTELKIGYSNKATQIRAEAQRKASGIFMWAVLVVGILNKAYDSGRIHALQRVLHDIPGDLYSLFRDILTRDSHKTSELMFCTEWILFANEPLSPAELYFAILAGVEPEAILEWDEDEISEDIFRKFILDSSKGLAQFTVSDQPKVQFIHESVRDFLLKKDGMDHIRSTGGNDFIGESQKRLARCCFKYIQMSVLLHPDSELEQKQRSKKLFTSPISRYPFLRYAIQSMGHHAGAAKSQLNFEQCGSSHGRDPYIICVDQDFDDADGEDEEMSMLALSAHPDDSAGLCFASVTRRNEQVVRTFVDEPYDTEKHSLVKDLGNENRYLDFRQALSTMSASLDTKLNASLVRIRQFDHRTKDIIGQLPLTWAVEYDKDAMLRIVLGLHAPDDYKHKHSTSYRNLGNVLIVAAADGSVKKVQLLLNSGADPNLQGGYYGNALQAAISRGSEPIVRLLLKHGADVNIRGGCFDNALYAASVVGHKEIAELLLQHGADVTMYGGYHGTALNAALRNDQTEVAKLLKNHGKVKSQKPSTPSSSGKPSSGLTDDGQVSMHPLSTSLSSRKPPRDDSISKRLWRSREWVKGKLT